MRKLKQKQIFICVNCGKEKIKHRNSFGIYCSNYCQHDYVNKKNIEAWYNGASIAPKTIKKHLMKKYDGKCFRCGINEWLDEPLVIELDHVDGNSENNKPDNIRLLCPNCHSQTDTYKGKNKGNGRYIRRKRCSEGKSY